MKRELFSDVTLKNGEIGVIVEIHGDIYFVDVSSAVRNDPAVDYIRIVSEDEIEED